ncbi:MAG: hypothetical protein WAZ94_07835 [Phycisphaerales bacterium]
MANAKIAHLQGKIAHGMARFKAGKNFLGSIIVWSGQSGDAKAQNAHPNAVNQPRKDPTISARTGSAPTQLGAAKMKAQSASLGA